MSTETGRRTLSVLAFGERSLNALNERAHELLETVGLRDLAGAITVELPYGRIRRARNRHHAGAGSAVDCCSMKPTQGMGTKTSIA